MRTGIKNLFLLPLLIAALAMIMACRLTAQTFTTLHSFNPFDRNDGNYPHGLVLSSNALYGTLEYGGSSPGDGMVFAINTDGTGFTNLHSFTATSCFGCPNSDGANPYAGVILLGNTLYGTVLRGGISGNGTVFAVNTDGTGFTSLYNFTATSISPSGVYTNSDGANPAAGLILSSSTLYGTTYSGGSWSGGTVFSLSLPVPPKLSALGRKFGDVFISGSQGQLSLVIQPVDEALKIGTSEFPFKGFCDLLI